MTFNDRVKRSWESALSILNPSSKELDYALQLHRESLVWDAYAFVPTRISNLKLLEQCINEGASRNEIKNRLENDSQVNFLQDSKMRSEYATAWEKSGVDCVFLNCGEESNHIDTLLKRFARYKHSADLYPDMLRFCSFPDAVSNAAQEKIPAIYPTCNGVPLPDRLESGEEALTFLETFFQLGIRMMHMTYNRNNLLGGGCAEGNDIGLSDLGKAAIKEMNRLGIIPDISHSSQNTSIDSAKLSSKPVVASHSVAKSLTGHFRGKEDETIKAICDSGGYIGVCWIPGFLGGSGKIDAALDHLEYLIKKFSAKHVAIGSDRGANCGNSEKSDIQYKSRNIFESHWPKQRYAMDVNIEMYESLDWTNWPLITVGLHQRGFSDQEIKLVIGENVKRVAIETLK